MALPPSEVPRPGKMAVVPEPRLPTLMVSVQDRPWWGLGLLEREKEFEMTPPPGTTLDQVMEKAEEVRASGGNCRVIWPD